MGMSHKKQYVRVHHQMSDQLTRDQLVDIKCRFSTSLWLFMVNKCRRNLCSSLQMKPVPLTWGNDWQAWSLWGCVFQCWPVVLCMWWTVWMDLMCSCSVESTAVLHSVDWCFDHRKQLHDWNTSRSSSGSNYNKYQFLPRLSAQLRRGGTVNAAPQCTLIWQKTRLYHQSRGTCFLMPNQPEWSWLLHRWCAS